MSKPSHSSRFRAPRQFQRDTRNKLNRKVPLIFILVALALALAFNYRGRLQLGKRLKAARIKIVDSGDLQQVILDELAKVGIREEWTYNRPAQQGQQEPGIIKVRVPRDVSLTLCNLRLHQLMEKIGGTIHSAVENVRENQIELSLRCQKGFAQSVLLKRDNNIQRGAVRIALLVDTVGNSPGRMLQELFKLKRSITFCVLPGSDYSGEIARLAHHKGYETILHQPVRTGTSVDQADILHALDSTMSQSQVDEEVGLSLQEVAHAKGICPVLHTRQTDQRLITKVMNVAREKSLYYVDTSSLPQEAVAKAAEKAGVRTGRVRLHLESHKGSDHIKKQLERLSNYAMKNGRALAIGQLSKETVRAFKEYIPVIEGRGIELVFASDLVE